MLQLAVTADQLILFSVALRPNADHGPPHSQSFYEGWNFKSGNYLFTTDTK